MDHKLPEKLEEVISLPSQSKDLDFDELLRQMYFLTKKINEIIDYLERKAEEV